jgi:hypothetical protein
MKKLLKKKRKKKRKRKERLIKRKNSRIDTADLAKDTVPWQHGCLSSAWNNATPG